MNIYINVRNVEKLSQEENKSGLINDLLDKHYQHKSADYPKIRMSDSGLIEKTEDDPRSAELCKHGSDPKMCKFAKPGKPCK